MADTPKTIWPQTQGQEPAKLCTVDTDTEMGVHIGPLEGETPEQHADRVYQELRDQHANSGGPSQWMKDAVALYHLTVKVEGPASPWVLTKTGRVQDLTDEDLEGFEFLPVEHEPGDAAVVAKAIQDMSLEEKIAFGRSMLEGVESHLDEAIEGGPFWEDYDVTPQEPTPEAIERGRELMDRLVPVPGSRMIGRFDAQDTPSDVITDLRAFIDSLDDDGA